MTQPLKKFGSLYVPGKLPTYCSPKPTFCPKREVSVNVGLEEGRNVKWSKHFYPEFNFDLQHYFAQIYYFFLFWISFHSYCSKFPSSGTGSAIPVCRTKEVWSENEVEFMSTLYLPRNSPVYWPIQVSDEHNYMYFKILKIIPSNSKLKMSHTVQFQKISIPSPRKATKILREGGLKRCNFWGGGGGFLGPFFPWAEVRLVSFCSSAVQY